MQRVRALRGSNWMSVMTVSSCSALSCARASGPSPALCNVSAGASSDVARLIHAVNVHVPVKACVPSSRLCRGSRVDSELKLTDLQQVSQAVLPHR